MKQRYIVRHTDGQKGFFFRYRAMKMARSLARTAEPFSVVVSHIRHAPYSPVWINRNGEMVPILYPPQNPRGTLKLKARQNAAGWWTVECPALHATGNGPTYQAALEDTAGPDGLLAGRDVRRMAEDHTVFLQAAKDCLAQHQDRAQINEAFPDDQEN